MVRNPNPTNLTNPSNLTNHEVLENFDQVEAGVADGGRDARAPAQVDDAPEDSEDAGRDGDVVALQQMSEAECHARHDEPDYRTAQPDVETMQDERPLDFFAHAAGDDDDHGEDPHVARAL